MNRMYKRVLCVLIVIAVFSCSALAKSPDEKKSASDETSLLTVNTSAECDIDAKAYALMDVNTGTLLLAKNEHDRLYPASVTKIMTLLLTAEAIEAGKMKSDTVIACSETAAKKGGSQIWLEAGEEMTVDELLRATVIYSANDACTLLAETVGGSEQGFVMLMNKKAKELGMKDTVFDNCTGLDDDTEKHRSSAYDIALMSRALLQHEMIRKYTTVWMDSLRSGKTQLVNTNRMIRYYPGATGLKTGTTSKAGCCVSASAERDGLGLIAVVLGAPNSNARFNGARELLDEGFASYEIWKPQADSSQFPDIPVEHGVKAFVKAECVQTEDVLIDKGAKDGITQKIELPDKLTASVEKGRKIGTISFLSDGKKIAVYDITAAFTVERMTFGKAVSALLTSFRAKA